MRNTFFKLWVHAIIYTKQNRMQIVSEMETLLYQEIENRLIEQGCDVRSVNGFDDHVHFLFTQNPLLSLHDTIRFVQNLTQRWYQMQDKNTGWYKFSWDDGYCTYSVSESILNKVQLFIEEQKTIHKKISFLEEKDNLNFLHKVDIKELNKKQNLWIE